MAITASILAITLRWEYLGQRMQTKRYFEPEGAVFLNADPVHVGEAYWNHVKAAWRACCPQAQANVFQSVLVEEVGGGLGFAEYAVPTGEKAGTRTGTLGNPMPSFVAVGMRFTVAARVTRPGQMRIPFLDEVDNQVNTVGPDFTILANTLGQLYVTPMVLGAPVATGVLHHIVVKRSRVEPYEILASQRVTGRVLNPNVTSQNSRKVGRGI